jgi:hypothetical protein
LSGGLRGPPSLRSDPTEGGGFAPETPGVA